MDKQDGQDWGLDWVGWRQLLDIPLISAHILVIGVGMEGETWGQMGAWRAVLGAIWVVLTGR